MSSGYAFWSLAYKYKWASETQLRLVVITETNPNGEITVDEFQSITGKTS